ncbi:Hypothetical predicted protein [Mytilus galloprovincialis]|uniref:DNA 3'-5' helicase n=1 Tax=Mytilus galloprovincialis TaxID=29158 RepID=A0A8B6F1M0_MYTGA|nr:Hypothetical predicted protein [Mytilus galloprovincialis]
MEKFNFMLQSKKVLSQINIYRLKEYSFFKPSQVKCLKSALVGDTVCVLPTGYGKSLIFEALPFFSNGVVIVVSPLNSILYEQLDRYGDLAIHFNELLYKNSGAKIPSNVKYVIGHPEQFINKEAFQLLKCELRDRITHIVVDEAHCVVQWGNGFREQFYELIKLRSLFPSAKILALTATATTEMQAEIVKRLGMKGVGTIVGNMDRPNIKLVVSTRPAGCGGKTRVEDSYDYIYSPLCAELGNMKELFPKTVVYTKLKWCGYGQELFIRLDPDLKDYVAQYHSPCTPQMKSKVLNSMAQMDSSIRLLFATEAYSMGTDAPDIRRVIHAGVPSTMETYIQEIGRAGRDGNPAIAKLFFNKMDISSAAKGMTDGMRNYCQSKECRRDYICTHFGFNNCFDKEKHDCCDICELKCTCDSCFAQLTENIEEHPVCETKKVTVKRKTVTEINQLLCEYFEAENTSVEMPSASLYTGLDSLLAAKIAKNYNIYDNTDVIKSDFPFIAEEVSLNISLIVKAIVENEKK